MSLHSHGLRLVQTEPKLPHSTAQRVLEILGDTQPPAGMDIRGVRHRYNLSRRQFLADMQSVESVYHILPAEQGVPRLTVIRPRNFRQGDSLPAIVYLHGGGWTLGSLATYEPFCRALANTTGQIVIWAEYRLAPEAPYPAALNDTLAAWRWVQQNYRELGADPMRISIGGDSAGGNLAAVAALVLRGESGIQPWRQLLLYPCLDMSASQVSHRKFSEGYLLTAPLYAWYRNQYAPPGVARDDWRLSPLFADDLAHLPPAIILYAGFDPLRDEAVAYIMKLTLAGVPVEPLYFADMIHGFLTMGGAIPAAQVALDRVAHAFTALTHRTAGRAIAALHPNGQLAAGPGWCRLTLKGGGPI
jgi:acetyl esterase